MFKSHAFIKENGPVNFWVEYESPRSQEFQHEGHCRERTVAKDIRVYQGFNSFYIQVQW